MPHCAVAGCTNNERNSTMGITFHRIPKDSTRRKAWAEACKRADKFSLDTARVCSVHFEENCFVRDFQAEILNLKPLKKLKLTAIPLLHIPTTRHVDLQLKKEVKLSADDVTKKRKTRPRRRKRKIISEENTDSTKEEYSNGNGYVCQDADESMDIEEHSVLFKQEFVEVKQEPEQEKNDVEDLAHTSTIWIKSEPEEALEGCVDHHPEDLMLTETGETQTSRFETSKPLVTSSTNPTTLSQPNYVEVSQSRPLDNISVFPPMPTSSSTTITAPSIEQSPGPNERCLVLLPQQSQGVGLRPALTSLTLSQQSSSVLPLVHPLWKSRPSTNPPVADESETITFSLAQFTPSNRVAIKRKLIEVFDNFIKENTNCEDLTVYTATDDVRDKL